MRVLESPLAGNFIVPGSIGRIDLSNLWLQGVAWVRLLHQVHDRQQHFADRQTGRPLFLPQNVEANPPVTVDVGMVNFSPESALWRLQRISVRHSYSQVEETLSVGRILGTRDSRLPRVQVVFVCGPNFDQRRQLTL